MSRGAKGSSNRGAGVLLAQILSAKKAGEMWAGFYDMENGDLVSEVPLLRLSEGQEVEMRIDFRSKWISDE